MLVQEFTVQFNVVLLHFYHCTCSLAKTITTVLFNFVITYVVQCITMQFGRFWVGTFFKILG